MGSQRERQRGVHGRAPVGGAGHALLWGLVLIACGPVYQLQSDYLYQPPRTHADASLPEGAERWWRDVEGGRVEAWFLPPLEAPERQTGAVVFAHGNAERIDGWAERLEPYRAMGLAVLLVEYRGYGRSGGAPSEAAIVDDFVHFVDRLTERPDVDGQRLLFHGRSLGGGVVGALSTERRCAAMVLESSFTNVPDLASQWMVPMAAIRDRYDTREALLDGYQPTLILHGARDTLVPVRHAVELDRTAWDSRLVVFDEAGHDDLPRTDEAYWAPIRRLLDAADVLP